MFEYNDREEQRRLEATDKKRCFNCSHFLPDPACRGDWIGYCEVLDKAWALGTIEFSRTCYQWKESSDPEGESE